jgi:hypothetical protein
LSSAVGCPKYYFKMDVMEKIYLLNAISQMLDLNCSSGVVYWLEQEPANEDEGPLSRSLAFLQIA